jgi:membrane protein DedA with SNARE-associated domain
MRHRSASATGGTDGSCRTFSLAVGTSGPRDPSNCNLSYGVTSPQTARAVMAMPEFDPSGWIAAYGYWAVLVLVGLESMGLPLPGETALIAAAVYAGTRHQLDIVGVIAAASVGAVVGDNIGYEIGRRLGFPLLVRYGPRIGLDERRLKLGRYLFRRYGGSIVFFGRFIALLRTFAALLAGANRMPWPRFFFFNAAGAVTWASMFGIGGYLLGASVHRISGPLGIGLLILGITAVLAAFVFLRRHEQALLAAAERALPGSVNNPRVPR